jgi:DNA-binding beta-propeller fold protein YncE
VRRAVIVTKNATCDEHCVYGGVTEPARSILSRARPGAASGTTALAIAVLLGSCGDDRAASLADAGPPPEVAAIDGARDRIFVSQAGSATIVAIDGHSGAVEARIEVGMLPHQLVLSRDRRTLYAALVGSQAVAEIDVATARLRRTMLTAPVPATRPDGSVIQPHVDQGAFEHTTCYDCHRPGGAQPKYAGVRPFGLLLSPDGNHLLVSHLRSSDLAVLDLASGQVETRIPLAPVGAATEAVALARLDGEIWVALRPPQPSTSPGALRRLDAATLGPLGDEPTGADPTQLLALPDRHSVLVSNFESNTVTEHGPGAPIAHDAAPGPLGMAVLPSGEVLALDYYSNAISVIDPGAGAGRSRTVRLERDGAPYANPTQAAVSGDGRSAWVVSGAPDGHLLELDLASLRVVRELPIDGLSFGVAVVSGP